MKKEHIYNLTVKWTGNKGKGTKDYKAYERSHSIVIDDKPDILSSSDPSFRGDATKHNPEELLVASLSSCHMLWYLHLCADAGIIVVDYIDKAAGVMVETPTGGHFSEVTLHPIVTITEDSQITKANELHVMANRLCFIANSVNFKVKHIPVCKVVEMLPNK